MNQVFVVDAHQQPLTAIHPAEARKLLRDGKAAVWRKYPFTLILKAAVSAPQAEVEPLRLKVDPGSQTTGLAVVNDHTGQIVWAAELHHRGAQIREALTRRRSLRRSRRGRTTRYRAPRFQNRCRPAGWLPPSLVSRVANVTTWVARLQRVCLIGALSLELVRFDTQALQNPEISGAAYQHGTLAGYETREYLLQKWGRQCAYCNATGVPLEVEHIVPRSRGGSDRVSNLTLACVLCNQAKSNQDVRAFLAHDPLRLTRLLVQAQAPLKDAAAVNATRWALHAQLVATGLLVEVGTGGRTKWNRMQQGLPKSHWLDAACVGASTPPALWRAGPPRPLTIQATGHGRRQRCGTDRYGFPTRHAPRAKAFLGFQTGDIVRARIPTGKYAGTHVGRVAIRFRPSFRLNGFDVHPRYLTRLHRADGYTYG